MSDPLLPASNRVSKKTFLSLVSNVTQSNYTITVLVILVVMLLVLGPDGLLSHWNGPGYTMVKGHSEVTVLTDSLFMVPDVKAWRTNPKLGSSDQQQFDQLQMDSSGPKKAPGDYAGQDMMGEKAPAAAQGSASVVGMAAGAGAFESVSAEAALSALPKNTNSLAGLVLNPKIRTPDVILVLALNPEQYKVEYMEKVIANREQYAKMHGYGLYVRYVTDFKAEYSASLTSSPSWAKLFIMRAALHAFPKAKHFWYLDHNAFIVKMEQNLVNSIIAPEALGPAMLRGTNLVSVSNVIRTYMNRAADEVQLIITQDAIGLNSVSFIFANVDIDGGLFANSLLDFWNNPLSRSYMYFPNADSSALNHILQWHPTYLSRTAVVQPRLLAAYDRFSTNEPALAVNSLERTYQENDFVVVVSSCESSSTMNCLMDLSNTVPQSSSSNKYPDAMV